MGYHAGREVPDCSPSRLPLVSSNGGTRLFPVGQRIAPLCRDAQDYKGGRGASIWVKWTIFPRLGARRILLLLLFRGE